MTSVLSLRGVVFEALRVGVGFESCEIEFLGGTSYSLVQTRLLYDVSFSHNAQRHRRTDRQTTVSCQ